MIKAEISDVRRNCLNYLVSLGYVKKKEDKLYRISYSYAVHPYRPFVIPFRGVVIPKVTNSHTENMILDGRNNLKPSSDNIDTNGHKEGQVGRIAEDKIMQIEYP